MIEVEIEMEDEIRICISGHAGYAPEGQDIVCSAISALAYTLIEYVIHHGGSYTDSGNRMMIKSPVTSRTRDTIQAICEGMQMVEAEHPECVLVKQSEMGVH